MDVYRVDLATGAFALDTENPGDVAGWIPDATLQVRGAQIVPPDGGTEIRIRDDLKSPWRSWMKVGPEEILDFVGLRGRRPSRDRDLLGRQQHSARRPARHRQRR